MHRGSRLVFPLAGVWPFLAFQFPLRPGFDLFCFAFLMYRPVFLFINALSSFPFINLVYKNRQVTQSVSH